MYNKLSIPEALETTRQELTAWATRMKRYTREVEARVNNPKWEQTHPGWRLNNTEEYGKCQWQYY